MQGKNIADIAEEIKARVDMRQIAELYHLEVNSSGFAHCPFHAGDRTPSLRIYGGNKGFYCFGCGAGSSVIDFVERAEKTSLVSACKKIDADFKLGLFEQRITRNERLRRTIERSQLNRERENAKKREIEAEEEYYTLLKRVDEYSSIIKNQAPQTSADKLTDEFIEAIKNIDTAKFMLEMAEYEWRKACKQI